MYSSMEIKRIVWWKYLTSWYILEHLSPALNYVNTKIQVQFHGSCLKQDKLTFNHKTVVNINNVFEINLWPFKQRTERWFFLGNFLFGFVQLTMNFDFDKYIYSGYNIGFDACWSFLLSDGKRFGKNIIIFGADLSLSAYLPMLMIEKQS